MKYSFSCECGNDLEVTATQAGTEISCACGNDARVPLLSQLRKLAGQGAYEAGTIETIIRLTRDGELPHGDICVISGLPTSDCYELYVQCESKWMKGIGKGQYLLIILTMVLLPIWILWFFLGKALANDERQELGRDRGVYAPIRVRQEFHEQLRQTRSQAKLRKALRTVPVYSSLLDEFPRAKITS